MPARSDGRWDAEPAGTVRLPRLYERVEQVGDRPLEETERVARAQGGDVRAYEALVEQYQELAFRVAYVITADAAEAEEAAQDAFVKAYYALHRFRTGEPFRPWLLRIVANEARNRRKAADRRLRLALRAVDAARGSAGDTVPSPELAALAQERRRRLVLALDHLRDDDRAIITYRYLLDLSEAEMADALGCARGTVKSRLSRALGRLRALLTGPREEPLPTDPRGDPSDRA